MKRSHIIMIIMAILILPITCAVHYMACNVATAPTRVINKVVTADNILHNYEWFYDVLHKVKARQGQIKQHKGFLKSEADSKEKRRLRIELAAMQQSCRDLVEQYNANSKKLNRRLFKAKDLPYQIDINQCE